MKKCVFILFLFVSIHLNAQKTIEQIIDNPEVKTIVINDDAIFKLNIITTSESKIKMQAKIEGEYANDMIVFAKTNNDSLYILSGFKPFFKMPNDKLSAHKVISIVVDLWIPEWLNVNVKSNIASAEITGNYKTLTAQLSQGNTTILNFQGNAIINSVNGNIAIETNYAQVQAYSKTGIINNEEISKGENQIKINTINGNISVIKTEK